MAQQVMSHHTGPQEPGILDQITIDLLLKVANVTFLHPFVAWMIPLCLRAQEYPMDCFSMRASITWAAALTLLFFLSSLNKQIAYSSPRQVDLSEEVIVITGGAGGLGLLLAETYGMRGASVAVLDIKTLEEGEARGVRSYECDVSDASQVANAAAQIEKEVGFTGDTASTTSGPLTMGFPLTNAEQLGTPTILINNAGVVMGGNLLDLSIEQVEKSIGVNLLAHFYTIKTFLPAMLRAGRGTIVTVASVIGITGAAQLTDYAAAKAGLIAMHTSLSAELRSHPEIKTVLVTPGQLSTPLFEGVKTPSRFFAPIVEPVEVAKEIIATIDKGESDIIAMPLYARWVGWLNVLPAGVQSIARWASGVDVGMQTFKAPGNKE